MLLPMNIVIFITNINWTVFMKISAKMHYGLKAMIEVALFAGEKGLLQKEIVERQCLPGKFMDTIIHSLKVAGLIINVSGKKSGYKLARPAGEISVYDIYRAFEPELSIHFCLSARDVCPKASACASHEFLCRFNQKMEAYMQDNSLEALSIKQRELEQALSEQAL